MLYNRIPGFVNGQMVSVVGVEKNKELSEAQSISNATRVQLSGVAKSLHSHFPIL